MDNQNWGQVGGSADPMDLFMDLGESEGVFIPYDPSVLGGSSMASTPAPPQSTSAARKVQEGGVSKRKQNSSCDACKLRRIKCDLSLLLSTQPSCTSCTKCTEKGIACTTSKIQTRKPARRTGARIEAARREFGGVEPGSGGEGKEDGGVVMQDRPVLAGQGEGFQLEEGWDQEGMATTGLLGMQGHPGDLKRLRSFNNGSGAPMPSHQPPNNSAQQISTPLAFTPSNWINHSAFSPSHPHPPSAFTPSPPSDLSRRTSLLDTDAPFPAEFAYLMEPMSSGSAAALEGDGMTVVLAGEEDLMEVSLGRAGGVDMGLWKGSMERELSRHLINTFFKSVHFQQPVIDPTDFKRAFDAADQVAERMDTPGNRVICSVMQAWGARFSGNPVVFGLQSSVGGDPLSELDPFQLIPGGADRAQWSRAREAACRTLMERAMEQMDRAGIMRKPSLESVQCLLLLAKLLELSHKTSKPSREEYLEMRAVRTAACGHIQSMEMCDTIDLRDGNDVVTALQKIRHSRAYWTAWCEDAFSAASRRCRPAFEDDEVIMNVPTSRPANGMPLTIDQGLKGFVSMWGNFGSIARYIATNITRPANRPQNQDIHELIRHCEKSWKTAHAAYDDLNVYSKKATLLFTHEPVTLGGFAPLPWIVGGKLGWAGLFLLIHDTIRERLQYEMSRKPSANIETLDSPHGSAEQTNISLCKALLQRSGMNLLKACRIAARVMKVILPSGMLQTNSNVVDSSAHIARALAETPTIEQGFPLDPNGDHWTWEQKMDLVSCCREAMYQSSWAWTHVVDPLDDVAEAMVRLQPPGMRPWQPVDDYVPKPEDTLESAQIGYMLKNCHMQVTPMILAAMNSGTLNGVGASPGPSDGNSFPQISSLAEVLVDGWPAMMGDNAGHTEWEQGR